MQEWSVPAWAVVAALALVLVALAGLVVCLVALARTRARLAETAALRERIADVERRLAGPEEGPGDGADAVPRAPHDGPEEYVITHVGEPQPPAPTVPGPLFADLVLRESVVRVVSLAAGMRRALAPETRNRIRFEMRREVKRARKQRKTDLRQARREWEARQRADLGGSAA
jgi:hypothetical protein